MYSSLDSAGYGQDILDGRTHNYKTPCRGHAQGFPGSILQAYLFHLHAPFFTGKIQGSPFRGGTHEDIGIFPSAFAFVQSVCMTGERSMSANISLRLFSVLAANSLPSLFTMPFEMLSFPSVRSERNFLLLSMDVQQSLFSRKRNALTLPP